MFIRKSKKPIQTPVQISPPRPDWTNPSTDPREPLPPGVQQPDEPAFQEEKPEEKKVPRAHR